MRITVYDVLDYLASGMSLNEILDDSIYLTETDIRACLAYAADREKEQTAVYTDETPMNIKKIIQLVFLFSISIFVVGLLGCERVNQVLDLQIETVTPIQQRDHVWPVDQNGIEVPIPGTWVLVSHTHENSTSTIGDSFILPADPQPILQVSDGTYTDGEGALWTKVRLIIANGDRWQFLERVDTSVTPHQLHAIFKVDDTGIPILEYGTYPFDLPQYNVQIWEKQ